MSRFAVSLFIMTALAVVVPVPASAFAVEDAAAAPQSIAVTGDGGVLPRRDTRQLTARATYSDGSTADVTSSATWASSNPSVASVDSSGVVTAVSGGTANITASIDSVTSNSFRIVTSFCTHIGTDGADSITGTPDADFICAGGGDDTIDALAGNDIVDAGAGVDTISGGGDNDVIYGGDDADSVNGDGGADLVLGGAGSDILIGGSENDLLFGEAGGDTLTGNDGADRLEGGVGDDDIDGSAGDDRLLPGDGSDDMVGGIGRDSVNFYDSTTGVVADLAGGTVTRGADGGTIIGVEDVLGSPLDDQITGDGGANTLLGMAGPDTVMGGGADDALVGGTGGDTLIGEDGNDSLVGEDDSDELAGGAGDDRLHSGNGDDSLTGGTGDDQLRGNGGHDTLDGQADNDLVIPGVGDDSAVGSGGIDSVYYADLPGPMNLDLEAGTATGVGTDILSGFESAYGTAGPDTLAPAATGSVLVGLGGDDVFTGGAGNDTVRGGPGDDQIFGGGGADWLAGNEDDDTINGGADADRMFGNDGIDVIAGDAGTDSAYGGDGPDSMAGGTENDQLFGEAGGDSLYGDAGNDTLTPGADDDPTLDGGEGEDIVVYNGAPSGVAVDLSTGSVTGGSGTDAVQNIENAMGTAHDDVLDGNALANRMVGLGGSDTISGGHLADRLYGGGGNDALGGGDGDDLLAGDAGNDDLLGGFGNDSLHGSDGVDTLDGGGNDDALYPGTGDESQVNGGDGIDRVSYHMLPGPVTINLEGLSQTATGGGGNDSLTGMEGAQGSEGDDTIFGDGGPNALWGDGGSDTINGRGGDDVIKGRAGDDFLRGGDGADDIYGDAGTDTCGDASDVRDSCELAFNEPPALTIVGTSNSFTEDEPAKAVDSTLTLTDDEPNSDGATVTIGSGFESGKDVLSTGAALPAGVTASYVAPTLTISGTATVAQYQAILRSVRFQNTSQDPSTAVRTISFSVTDGEFTDSGNNVSMSVQRVNDKPVATPETYSGGTRGIRMRVGTTHGDSHETEHTGDVLNGDSDVDTPAANLTATPGTLTSTDCVSVCPGNVTMQTDGTFTYDPPAGDDGTDSFTYTVEDNDTGDSDATEGTHTASVTLTRNGPRVWFVDDSAAAGGRGVSHAPLQSLAPLAAGGARDSQDGAGDRIFVYSGTYTSGIDLEASQKLLGEPEGLNANSQQFVAAGGSRPAISSPSTHAVALHSGNEVQDVALGGTPAGSYSLHAPAGAGAFTVAGTNIDNPTGGGMQLEDGTPTVTLGTLSSSGSSASALRIVNTDGGSVTSTGGLLQNAAGAVVAVSSANSSLTLGSNISDDTGQLINMSGSSGAVTFNGTITDGEDGDGDGIAITAMSAPVAFTNELLLSTNNASAPAFSMTSSNAGNLRIDPPGTTTTNRLASSGNAALRVTDTPVHADGLQFQKIATSGTFGDRYGIQLENTGSAGRLNVTGTGVANSGGQILGRQEGIRLINTNGPSLNWMKLSGHSDYAIRGITVRGLNMDRTVIDGSVPNVHGLGHNGNDTNTNEGSVRFNELTGTGLTITNSTIKNGYGWDFRLENSAGTLNRLTVTGTTFNQTFTTGEDSVLVESSGTAVLNATFDGNTFQGARGDHIDFNAVGSSASDVIIRNNVLTNNHPNSLGGQINAEAGASGDLTYDIDGNNIRGAIGTAIVTGKLWGGGAGDGTAFGRIRNNIVGQSGVAGSGSIAGSGIDVSHLAQGTHTVAIQNNQVRQYNQHGILINVGGASRTVTGLPHTGSLNLTVTGNTLAEPANVTPSTSSGLQLIAGTNSGDPPGTAPDQYNVCLGLSGNNLGAAGDESSSAGRDYIFRQRFEAVVRLPGYIGPSQGTSADMTTALTSYMSGRDTGVGGPFSVFASAESTDYDGDTTDDDGFLNTAGSAACPTP